VEGGRYVIGVWKCSEKEGEEEGVRVAGGRCVSVWKNCGR